MKRLSEYVWPSYLWLKQIQQSIKVFLATKVTYASNNSDNPDKPHTWSFGESAVSSRTSSEHFSAKQKNQTSSMDRTFDYCPSSSTQTSTEDIKYLSWLGEKWYIYLFIWELLTYWWHPKINSLHGFILVYRMSGEHELNKGYCTITLRSCFWVSNKQLLGH